MTVQASTEEPSVSDSSLLTASRRNVLSGFRLAWPVPSTIIAIVLVVVAGSAALLPVWAEAWHLWSSDPLRSIGMVFPLLSLLGVLAAWRRLQWALTGTWWGGALILFAMSVAGVFSAPMLLLFFFGSRVRLLHPGMALFCYAVGAVLLFGGKPLLRRAIAPLCLLLLLDPVPHLFNRLLDMPLQILSASTARAFAHLIGLRPTGVQLQMMFAPNFGMFIVPGCNGVRGAVTFGYLALLFGYVRRLPPRILALFTISAVLLGYAFNLIRLCTLVLYYRAGLSFPSIRNYGTQVDYGIGCILFLLATLGTGFAITFYQYRYGSKPQPREPLPQVSGSGRSTTPKILVLAAVALLFVLPQAHSFDSSFRPALSPDEILRNFPQNVGPYSLTNTWEERNSTGARMFLFGDYTRPEPASDPAHLTMGIYLASEDHYVFLSKLTQGIRPDFQTSFDTHTASAQPIHFFLSEYKESGKLTLDAEASCRMDGCGQTLQGQSSRVGLIGPRLTDLLAAPAGRRVPVLVRGVFVDGQESDSVLRARFEISVEEFTKGLDLHPLLRATQ